MLNRRKFIQSSVAVGVSVALFPRFEAQVPFELSAYPPGDIRRYGAIGDGMTDCSHALQQAIESGRAYIPKGNWRMYP